MPSFFLIFVVVQLCAALLFWMEVKTAQDKAPHLQLMLDLKTQENDSRQRIIDSLKKTAELYDERVLLMQRRLYLATRDPNDYPYSSGGWPDGPPPPVYIHKP